MDRTFHLPTCLLRPWRVDDLESLVRHANDPRVSATVRDHFPSPYTREDGQRWLAHAARAGRDTSLAIEVDGHAVGGVGMIAGEDVHRICAEIGYWLGHAFWNRGVMTDAVRAYSEHLLRDRGFLRLEAPVFAINPASARVLEKAGFERESVQRRAAIKTNQVIDVWLYVRLA
ncbi:MAG: GNAT family N-acetyltransferase [Sandaracinaceae bacterium]|nr:GNAT family N-acetyltransferase [Sandaracinaceae bacterium]